MNPIRRELEYFFGALRFFTRLPAPAWVGHSSEALERSTRYFPAVGLIIGGAAALCLTLTLTLWPITLAVLSSMVLTLMLTGIFHEDGWSDMVDGFGAHFARGRDAATAADKAEILRIMKDSRLGSFGAVALIVMLLAKFCALVEIEPWLLPFALLAGHAFSRLCATLVLHCLDYVRDEGKAKPLASALRPGELALAGLSALLPLFLLPLPQALAAAALALLATLWLGRLFKRRLGGYTGDCLGATQQLSELAFYCGLLCNFS
jgi:adenosylcobinamide-GDP ribazoletransferase